MTGDEPNDLMRALAGFGNPAIRYHSFGPSTLVAAPASSTPAPTSDPARPTVQPGPSPSSLNQPSLLLGRIPPTPPRTWPLPAAAAEPQPAVPAPALVAPGAPAPPVVAPLPVAAPTPAGSVRPTDAPQPVQPMPTPASGPPAPLQCRPPAWTAVPLPRAQGTASPFNPAAPAAFPTLAKVFQLLAGAPEPPVCPAQALSDILHQM